jgi:hypothetical protein
MDQKKNPYVYAMDVTCPHCHRHGTFALHTLADPMLERQAGNKVLQGDYFTWTCPHCGAVETFSHTMLYHDGSQKVLIGLADNEKDYDDLKARLTGNAEGDKLDDFLNDWVKDCTARLVTHIEDLQEKVLIHALHLDDRIIEIAKYKALQEYLKDHAEPDDLLFNTETEGYSFTVFKDEEAVDSIPFSKMLYKIYADHYEKLFEEDSEPEISHEWAESFLQNHQ